MSKPQHPTELPDIVARMLADLAREHGYGVERLTLSWLTKDLGQPLTARVAYEPDVWEERGLSGDIVRWGEM